MKLEELEQEQKSHIGLGTISLKTKNRDCTCRPVGFTIPNQVIVVEEDGRIVYKRYTEEGTLIPVENVW